MSHTGPMACPAICFIIDLEYRPWSSGTWEWFSGHHHLDLVIELAITESHSVNFIRLLNWNVALHLHWPHQIVSWKNFQHWTRAHYLLCPSSPWHHQPVSWSHNVGTTGRRTLHYSVLRSLSLATWRDHRQYVNPINRIIFNDIIITIIILIYLTYSLQLLAPRPSCPMLPSGLIQACLQDLHCTVCTSYSLHAVS